MCARHASLHGRARRSPCLDVPCLESDFVKRVCFQPQSPALQAHFGGDHHHQLLLHYCFVQCAIIECGITSNPMSCLQALHKVLKHEYRGYFVPPLPEKVRGRPHNLVHTACRRSLVVEEVQQRLEARHRGRPAHGFALESACSLLLI